jgi:hypothetical protein
MTLNDKFCELLNRDFGYDNQALSDKLEKVADEFAIGFNDWVNVNAYKFTTKTTTKELLEIYKKENKL